MTARTSLSISLRVEDFDLAMATYRAACLRWPGAAITIRQGARILEDSRKRRLA
jgi:hypothetical protein